MLDTCEVTAVRLVEDEWYVDLWGARELLHNLGSVDLAIIEEDRDLLAVTEFGPEGVEQAKHALGVAAAPLIVHGHEAQLLRDDAYGGDDGYGNEAALLL